jgi:hypothetical protein
MIRLKRPSWFSFRLGVGSANGARRCAARSRSRAAGRAGRADEGCDGHHDRDDGEENAGEAADPHGEREDQSDDRDDTPGKPIDSSFVPGHVGFLS